MIAYMLVKSFTSVFFNYLLQMFWVLLICGFYPDSFIKILLLSHVRFEEKDQVSFWFIENTSFCLLSEQ